MSSGRFPFSASVGDRTVVCHLIKKVETVLYGTVFPDDVLSVAVARAGECARGHTALHGLPRAGGGARTALAHHREESPRYILLLL